MIYQALVDSLLNCVKLPFRKGFFEEAWIGLVVIGKNWNGPNAGNRGVMKIFAWENLFMFTRMNNS